MPSIATSEPSSPSSEITGTVGLERPGAMAPRCWRGVFCGVGAVIEGAEMGTLEDMV